MLVCLDVQYGDTSATTALVGFGEWTASTALVERVVRSDVPPAPYQPGEFFRRELPYLLEVLRDLTGVRIVVVDGFVWLEAGRPGLGAHLHEATGHPVIGVAKRPYHGQGAAIPVLRGTSARPLHVTAVGVDPAEAAAQVRGMHGAHRIPTLLQRVDHLARGLV